MTSQNLSDQDLQFPGSRDVSEAASSAVVSLDMRRGKPAWERDIVATLCRFLELPDGWDSYAGKPLRHDTGMFALQVLSSIMNESVPLPSIVPVASGGVQFEWHQNQLDIELFIAAPYECELSVYDHLAAGTTPIIIPLRTDLRPLSYYVKQLTDFNRHLINQAHAG
jgi:hypothetical protein